MSQQLPEAATKLLSMPLSVEQRLELSANFGTASLIPLKHCQCPNGTSRSWSGVWQRPMLVPILRFPGMKSRDVSARSYDSRR